MHPALGFALFVLVPFSAWATWIGLLIFRKRSWNIGFREAHGSYVWRFSAVHSATNLLLAFLLAYNSVAYVLEQKLSLATDFNYFLSVNIPAFDAASVIGTAKSTQSLASFINSGGQVGQRRLGSTSSVVLVYHTDSYSNLVPDIDQVCKAESWIRKTVSCLNFPTVSVLDSICVDHADVDSTISNPEFSDSVEDSLDPSSPKTSIIMTFATSATCFEEYATSSSFYSALNQPGSTIRVTFFSSDFILEDFTDAIINASYLSVVSLLASLVFMVVALRGLGVVIITGTCIILSLVCALPTLPLFNYNEFSAFNVAGLFLLVGVGANHVLLWDSAFRSVVRGLGTAATLDTAYSSIGEAVIFTTLAAVLSLYSKMVSPVIVISQLGLFVGTSVVFFFIFFHLIVLPFYLVSFNSSVKFHTWIKSELSRVDPCNFQAAPMDRLPMDPKDDTVDSVVEGIANTSLHLLKTLR